MKKGIGKRFAAAVLSLAMMLGNTVGVSAEENAPAETEATETV